jgi:hypothetical protein
MRLEMIFLEHQTFFFPANLDELYEVDMSTYLFSLNLFIRK